MKYIFLIILVLLGFYMRIVCPSADPPHWSYVYNTDEGHYSYNTHNKLKYGEWFVNEAHYSLITPLFSYIQYKVATIVDSDSRISRYRSISILCGILSCVCMAFYFREKWVQYAAITICSISFIGIVHSRIGIPEAMLTLFFQITILTSWIGYTRNSIFLSCLSGILAVASITVKTTGLLIVPVILLAPVIHLANHDGNRRYLISAIAGVVCGLLIWFFVVIFPNREAWSYMQSMATQYGRDSIILNPYVLLKSIFKFMLSPALQTIPILWSMALCWCVFIFAPQFKSKSNSFLDTLMFLWLIIVGLGLALPAYQPARWQLVIFPPIIYCGLRFVRDCKDRNIMIFAFLLAVILALLSTTVFSKNILELTTNINPGNGIFSNVLFPLILVSAGIATYFIAKKYCREHWKVISATVLVLNLTVQIPLHAVYLIPSYVRDSQWHNVSIYLEQLSVNGNEVFSGDITQDLALHSDIHVLPTFYLVERENDPSLKKYYGNADQPPSYFILADYKQSRLQSEAPEFVKHIKEISRFPLLIGGLGYRNYYLYKITSYAWLDSGK